MTSEETGVGSDDQPAEPTRRQLLKYGTATAGIAGLSVAGWSLFGSGEDPDRPDGPGTSTPSGTDAPGETDPNETGRSYPYTDRFETVVDVAARGGDRGGETPINDILEGNLADDTLFFFPEGTYRIEGLFVVQHYDNVGFVGPAATLVPSPGRIGDWIVASDVSRFLFEGLRLSNAAEGTGARTKVHVNGGENVVRDVSITGFHDVETRTHGFTLQVKGADTTLRLENVDLADGAWNGTGIFVNPARDPGTLRLVDCHIENWYEQGLYGSSHGGPMYVVGGRYANCGRAQVRVGGGGADTEAVVRDVTVRMTDAEPAVEKERVRGIWVHEGENTLVENCDVALTDVSTAGSSGAVVVGAEQGRTTIRDSTIRVDDSTFAIAAPSPKQEDLIIPSMDGPPENWAVTVDNVTITGSADRDVGVWLVDRPGCVLRDLTIDHTGADRDGIGLLRSPGAEISGLSCSTAGYPLVADVASADGDCIATFERIDALERTAAPEGEATSTPATGTATDETATDGGPAGDRRTAVAPENGRYCLGPSDVERMAQWPAVGVTDLEGEKLYVRRLPETALNPY